MGLSVQFVPLSDVAAEWLIVPIFDEEVFSASLAAFDNRLGGVLGRLRQSGDLSGKANDLTPLLDCYGIQTKRLLVVGMGKRSDVDRISLTEAAAAAVRHLTDKPRRQIAFALPEHIESLKWSEVALAVGFGLMHGCQGPGLRKKEPSRHVPSEIVLIGPPGAPVEEVTQGANIADIEGRAVGLARELVNLPPCELYPETFAERARQAAIAARVECTVLDETQLAAEQMNALLGVARGSDRTPRLVVLRYSGSPAEYGETARRPLLACVGKGVTFDSGGLSLKDNDNMLDMKGDMAGAAAVLAGVCAMAELRLPVDVLGLLALVENMPSGKALKLGDVLRARNGTTIEVLNTDAEGRLILADALAYAVDQKATHIVDLATLTGSCMVALGEEVAGVFGNDGEWIIRVQAAAARAGERVWPLPMWSIYDESLKSDVADIKNVAGKRWGGAIIAAKFLQRFVGEVPWTHLDIAGPAWASGSCATHDSGGTGFGVRTLVELASELK
jgi:leucyl aminopeptidase